MHCEVWTRCLEHLEQDLPAQQFNTWVRPLHAVDDGGLLRLLAPNAYVRDWVDLNLREQIEKALNRLDSARANKVRVDVGSHAAVSTPSTPAPSNDLDTPPRPGANGSGLAPHYGATPVARMNSANGSSAPAAGQFSRDGQSAHTTPGQGNRGRLMPAAARGNKGLRAEFTFEKFVEGKSNQLAHAAALQVAENPGGAYNPLFIYGGVGLGKTHLMHAIGSEMVRLRPGANVVYLHSERFVADFVTAIRHKAMEDFKSFYRSLDALLIDDIQFFAGKNSSQEEFFHTFNALLEGQQQIVITCDCFAKEVDGLDERLKSRLGWGLQVAIEPPELETRAAILMRKAVSAAVDLPGEVALFVAERVRSNVRELEGALRRVIAHASFHKQPITLDLTREALRDLLAVHDRNVSLDNIKNTVSQYYKLRVSDMTSKRRTRSVARPRQVAMALSKELTHHSLPEIGDAFGGRDHTTVMHACKQIARLREEDAVIRDEYDQLLRTLNG